jgi:hypothetical protein
LVLLFNRVHDLVTDHPIIVITRAKQGQVNIGQTNELFIYTA